MSKNRDYLRPVLIGECEPQWEAAFLAASQLFDVESTGHEVIEEDETYFDEDWQ